MHPDPISCDDKGRAPTAEFAIDTARKYIGTRESPPGSNRTKFGAWYGFDGQPWCAMFQSYVASEIGLELPGATTAKGFAYCPYVARAARNSGSWYERGHGRAGDWVLFDWNGDGVADHVELVVSIDGERLTSIGGNTGAGNESDGGQVLEHAHGESVVLGYMRPPYATCDPGRSDQRAPRDPLAVDGLLGSDTVRRLQRALNAYGAQLVLDGQFGPMTRRALQARLRNIFPSVTINGEMGPETVRALQQHVGTAYDGYWGLATTMAIQRALNEDRF